MSLLQCTKKLLTGMSLLLPSPPGLLLCLQPVQLPTLPEGIPTLSASEVLERVQVALFKVSGMGNFLTDDSRARIVHCRSSDWAGDYAMSIE